MKTYLQLTMVAAIAAMVGLAACQKENTTQANNPQPLAPTNGTPTTTPVQPTTPTATATAPTATTTTTTPPTATATALPPGGEAALLLPLKQTHAPNSQPVGNALTGTLQPGTPLTIPVQIAAGKCFTAIAVAPGVDMLVELVATPPAPFPQHTVSKGEGNSQAIMAGNPNCFRNILPAPVQGILRVTARSGSGPLVAQLYAK
jgi:hypothetical protein